MTNEPEKVVIELTSEGEIFAQGSFDALNRLHALIGESEKLRKDAERYRWLRMADWWDSPLCAVRNPAKQVKPGSDCPSRDRLDAAIDSAMQGANHDNQ